MKIQFVINNQNKEFELKSETEILLDLLRRYGYVSVKEGCREGQCGACIVLVDGKAINSCLYPAFRANNKTVLTLEGLGQENGLDVIQKSFLEAGAVQCGYCTPGMILSTKALLDKNPSPTEDEIKVALEGNLCRCTGYIKILDAVKLAAKRIYKKLKV